METKNNILHARNVDHTNHGLKCRVQFPINKFKEVLILRIYYYDIQNNDPESREQSLFTKESTFLDNT